MGAQNLEDTEVGILKTHIELPCLSEHPVISIRSSIFRLSPAILHIELFCITGEPSVASIFRLRPAMLIREKKHRLSPESYEGRIEVAFTACVRHRLPLFVDASLVDKCVEILLREAANEHCDVLAFVFMPDHCHLIFRGREDRSNVLRLMNRFKQHTGYFFSQNSVGGRWQKDFYDHICRDEREVQEQIRYVVENPVRKGLVKHWKDYKFKGSTVFDLDEW